MSSHFSSSDNRIVIRQEVILPAGWGPLPAAEPALPAYSAPQASEAGPCGCGSSQGSRSGPRGPLAAFASVIVNEPAPVASGCWPAPGGRVIANITASGGIGPVGPVIVCAMCVDASVTSMPASPPLTGTTCLPEKTDGSTYPHRVPDISVPISAPGVPNKIFVWCRFPGDFHWVPAVNLFTPCASSLAAGPVSSMAALKHSDQAWNDMLANGGEITWPTV